MYTNYLSDTNTNKCWQHAVVTTEAATAMNVNKGGQVWMKADKQQWQQQLQQYQQQQQRQQQLRCHHQQLQLQT
jgi:hypothetical protein